MIKHIVMWKYKEFAHGNDRATNARMTKFERRDVVCREGSRQATPFGIYI